MNATVQCLRSVPELKIALRGYVVRFILGSVKIRLNIVFGVRNFLFCFTSTCRYSGALRSSGANAPPQYITAGEITDCTLFLDLVDLDLGPYYRNSRS